MPAMQKVLNEKLCHIGAEKSGQSEIEMDILDAQIKQGHQCDNSFLIIPYNDVFYDQKPSFKISE